MIIEYTNADFIEIGVTLTVFLVGCILYAVIRSYFEDKRWETEMGEELLRRKRLIQQLEKERFDFEKQIFDLKKKNQALKKEDD